jgi:hypothetical protein
MKAMPLLWLAVVVCTSFARQSGHRQPASVSVGTATTAGKSKHQQRPHAAPQANGRLQALHCLVESTGMSINPKVGFGQSNCRE